MGNGPIGTAAGGIGNGPIGTAAGGIGNGPIGTALATAGGIGNGPIGTAAGGIGNGPIGTAAGGIGNGPIGTAAGGIGNGPIGTANIVVAEAISITTRATFNIVPVRIDISPGGDRTAYNICLIRVTQTGNLCYNKSAIANIFSRRYSLDHLFSK